MIRVVPWVACLLTIACGTSGPSAAPTSVPASTTSATAAAHDVPVADTTEEREVALRSAHPEEQVLQQTTVIASPQGEHTPETTVVRPTGYGRGTSSRARRGPPRIRVGNPTVGPSYDRALVHRVVRRNISSIRLCYDGVITQHPDVAGTLRTRFVIATDGSVDQVQIITELHPKLDACVAAEIATWRFPRPRSPLTITYPFVFAPDRQPAPRSAPATSPPTASRARRTPPSDDRPVVLGSLSSHEIQRVIRRRMANLRRCYEAQEGRAGMVQPRIVIGPSGEVTDVTFGDDHRLTEEVQTCLSREIRAMRFPAPPGGGIVIVTYPMH